MNVKALLEAADPARHLKVPHADSPVGRDIFNQARSLSAELSQIDRRRKLRLRLSLGAVPAAAAAAVLAVVLLASPGGNPTSAAAAMLDQAAGAAAQGTQLAPGQYLYTETQSAYQATLYEPNASLSGLTQVATAQFSETGQAWTNATGAQSRTTDSTVRFSSAEDQTTWNADPSGASMLQNVAHFAENGGQTTAAQTPLDVSNLPTDPAALATVLANGEFHTNVDLIPAGPNATFERAAALLLAPTVSMDPSLASALFQVLGAQPGVQLIGAATDHEGQPGQAVRLASADGLTVSEVIVDPTTGQLLEADFAPPAQSIPASGGTICTGPANVPASSLTCRPTAGNQSTIAPFWTDVVAVGVVDSASATLAPAGNAPTTIGLVSAAPTGLQATPIGSGQTVNLGPAGNGNQQLEQVQLSWTAPADPGASPITDYVVYEYQDGQTPATGISAFFDMHSTQTTYVWNLLTTGQGPVLFTVQAVNGNGYGPASPPVTLAP